MYSILRNSLNIARILFRSYCTYDGSFCWFVNKHERWKGFSCWSIWGGPLREWNETWYLCSYHQCWYFDVDRKWPTVGHDLHRNSMGNSFICFRTTEQTLTIFDRNFPNKVWNSSHMTSNILMADQPKHCRTVVHDL